MTAQESKGEKIRKSEQMIRDAYYKNSQIEQLTSVKVCPEEPTFLRLGRRIYIPSEWYTRNDIFYDIALNQFGEGIARSEKKYIIDEILKNEKIERYKMATVTASSFKEQLEKFEKQFSPNIIFAPVEFFVNLTYTWSQEDKDFGQFNYENFKIKNKNYNLFWSNHYTPFKVFIFANKEYGEWLTKTSVKERFYVKIANSDKPESLDLTMYTLFKFSITNPEKIKIIEAKIEDVQ
jgi:hypothetical protein